MDGGGRIASGTAIESTNSRRFRRRREQLPRERKLFRHSDCRQHPPLLAPGGLMPAYICVILLNGFGKPPPFTKYQ